MQHERRRSRVAIAHHFDVAQRERSETDTEGLHHRFLRREPRREALGRVALAFDAAIPEAVDSSVTWGCASVWLDPHKAVTYKLPQAAREFIRDFDEGRPVSPFTFAPEVAA